MQSSMSWPPLSACKSSLLFVTVHQDVIWWAVEIEPVDVHCVSKNVTDVAHYGFDGVQPILVSILGNPYINSDTVLTRTLIRTYKSVK